MPDTGHSQGSLQASSTSVFRAARYLYDELANEHATWTDAIFWFVLGALIGGLAVGAIF